MTDHVTRPANFRVELQHLDGRADLALIGELDMAAAPTLHRAIDDITDDGHRTIRLNLSGLTFCDSTGVAALITAQARLNQLDGVLVAFDIRGGPRRVIEMMGLLAVLDPTADTAHA